MLTPYELTLFQMQLSLTGSVSVIEGRSPIALKKRRFPGNGLFRYKLFVFLHDIICCVYSLESLCQNDVFLVTVYSDINCSYFSTISYVVCIH